MRKCVWVLWAVIFFNLERCLIKDLLDKMVAVHLNFKTFSKYFQNELISLFFTLFTNYKCLTGEAPRFLCIPNDSLLVLS